MVVSLMQQHALFVVLFPVRNEIFQLVVDAVLDGY